jgi:hypothetical protein
MNPERDLLCVQNARFGARVYWLGNYSLGLLGPLFVDDGSWPARRAYRSTKYRNTSSGDLADSSSSRRRSASP